MATDGPGSTRGGDAVHRRAPESSGGLSESGRGGTGAIAGDFGRSSANFLAGANWASDLLLLRFSSF